MALIWTEMFDVKVRSFNTHHKRLVDLINEIEEAMLKGKTENVMGTTLKALSNYTIYHFAAEEKLMETNGYYGYASHKNQHDKFTRTINECIEKYESGRITVSVELTSFLRDWLKSHIMGTDMRYSRFFNSRGIR